jgi:DNA-binding MarR family transcriptional regulator
MQEKQAPEDVFMATLLTLGRRMRQRIEGDELDYSLIPVLKSLWENGPTRHTTLAERLMLDASTVSRKVRHLEDRGLVGVRNDEQDGRARQVEILPEGRRLLRQMIGRRHRLISSVLEGWPAPDRERLGELLDRFNRDLETKDTVSPHDGSEKRVS